MVDGFLFCTIMRLEQYCQQLHKWDKIHYGKAFMSLHSKVSPETEVCLLVQRWEGALEPLPDNKTREEKENEEISLINALNPRDTMFVAGGPPQSPSPLQATPEIGPREPMAPLLYDKGRISPQRPIRAPIWPGNLPIWSKAISFEAIPYRRNNPGRPAHWQLLSPYSISHSRITSLEEFQALI